jgi:hypothetical protein
MRAFARGLLIRLWRQRFPQIRLLVIIAILTASTVSTHAADWTGVFSSDWFLSGNWTADFPRQTTDGNINTVTPNSTMVASPGAQARNLAVGQNAIGMLVIENGGTLADSFGTVGNLPGSCGTVIILVGRRTMGRSSQRPTALDGMSSKQGDDRDSESEDRSARNSATLPLPVCHGCLH